MTTDLSICRDALNRDPVLYLDLTEAVRRQDGRVLGACPTGALVAFTDPADGLGHIQIQHRVTVHPVLADG